MMNIEQTKKMNLMIKELTKSGMVNSFDDAVTQATGLYQNSMPTHLQTSQVIEKPKPEMQKSVEMTENLDVEHTESVQKIAGLNNEQVKIIVDENINSVMKKNNTQIANEMKKIWDYIKDMKEGYESKISELKKELNASMQNNQNSQNNQGNQNLNNFSQGNNNNNNNRHAQQNKPKTQNVNPRQGEFTPDNVVLENYFYYGNK
jgi:hypothetical protein